jgi:hypothetical protein
VRRLLDVRIVRWELKLVSVVGAMVAGFAIPWLLRALGTMELPVIVIGFFFDLAAILLGARVFRGRGEAIDPPRPWWRMTARPTLSRRLGILFLVLTVWTAVGTILATIGVPSPGSMVADGAAVVAGLIGVLEFGGIAALYLNSAVRLKRLGVPAKDPKFRPTINLKA